VTRTILLFFVCFALPVGLWSPAAAASAGFDTAAAASVWGTALSYIAPRALQPLTMPQMTVWGLNGLTALDPELNATLQDGQLRLYGPDTLLIAVPAPAPDDGAAWGQAAAQIAAAAYAASPALQQAGVQAVISSFFDELFNHFDPYSRYEPPIQAAQDQLMITGLAGTGIVFGRDGGHVVIATIAADSPAAQAGLTVGTQVLSIDRAATYPAGLSRFNDDMNGIAGSTVTIVAADNLAPGGRQSITLTRAFVPPQTVFATPLGSILMLKISNFNKGTSDQFSELMAAAMEQTPPPSAIILDLRGNRGGVLRQAVLVADSLLVPGGIIAQASGRDAAADQVFDAEGSDLAAGAKIAVLVDGQTASAAEILAAALADNHRAVVIGSETLGKGLVQTLTTLPDGGELFVTWSRVLAPRGWPLQSLGVMPEICTSLGPSALQNQLDALAGGQNLMTPALTQARALRAPAPINTILAIRDQCPADIGSDQDVAAAQYVLGNDTAYNAALLQ
jgi:carboxyl-terminal processing protease